MKTPLDFSKKGEVGGELLQLGITKSFETGDQIISEQMTARSIPVVVEGRVKVIRTDEELKEMVLYYLQPGEACIMSFLAGLFNDTSKVKAVAESPCRVLFIPLQKMQQLIQENAEWLTYMFEIYHKRFEELLQVVDAIAFKSMDERLLNFIKKRSRVTRSKTLRMTHDQLAKELGTAREVISRLLKKMEEKDLVQLGRNKITLM